MKKIIICLLLLLCTNVHSVEGKFYGSIEGTDTNGNVNTYYQFRANDDSVWWLLTEEEMGFIPNGDTEYTLIYDDKGTTADNKPCDCKAEYECECEVYDDVFLSIERK